MLPDFNKIFTVFLLTIKSDHVILVTVYNLLRLKALPNGCTHSHKKPLKIIGLTDAEKIFPKIYILTDATGHKKSTPTSSQVGVLFCTYSSQT